MEQVGRLRPKRKVGFIFTTEAYVLLTQWLDPLGFLWRHGVKAYALATDVHLSSCKARVKGEAIYINYWRAVNIIS